MYRLQVALLVCVATVSSVKAQDFRSSSQHVACDPNEPDSVQINWRAPCDAGDWLMDTELGCRMWDWHPAPEDSATWTGTCVNGLKTGYGVVQWFEHGSAIDRFEGTFVAGRRQGYGHYAWNSSDWYTGFYLDDRPHGSGTAHIGGHAFTGQWENGCLRQGDRIVAINVSRVLCEQHLGRAVTQTHNGPLVARLGSR
jgi:hypothetical protein